MTVQSQTIQKAFMLIYTDSLLPLSFATLSIWIVNVLIFVWNLIRLSSDWHFIQSSHIKFSEIKTKYFRWKTFENQNKKENHDHFYEKKITLYITNFWGDLLKNIYEMVHFILYMIFLQIVRNNLLSHYQLKVSLYNIKNNNYVEYRYKVQINPCN